MSRAFVRTVNGDRFRGYREHHNTTFGEGCSATHIEVVCDNGVVVTVHPDGTVGRKDWSKRGGGMPRLR